MKNGGGKEMTLEERTMQNQNTVQNIVLENRKKLTISGVLDVLSFDDQIVILETDLGLLTVKVEDIRIHKLSIDTSDVILEGEINDMSYSAKSENKKATSFLGKIFK